MMINLDKLPRFAHYILYASLFITGQAAATWGLFATLNFKNLTMWQAYIKAIPFAWLDWIFMTLAINIGNKYDLVSPTQDIFMLIIVQFTLLLILNQFYLKQEVFRSDIIAFFIILIGFFVSFLHLVSKAFNIPIPEHVDSKGAGINPDEASSTIKSLRYNVVTKSKGDVTFADIKEAEPELKES